jgi:hypothetical protein
MSRRIIGGLVATLAITATLAAGAGPAGAAPASAPVTKAPTSTNVSGTSRLTPDVARTIKGAGPAAEQKALASYWTPKRMKAAVPDNQLPSLKAAAGRSAPTQRATPKTSTPQGPAARTAPAAPLVAPKVAPRSAATPMAYNPGYPVGSPVARTSGKVFFTSFGLNYVCSATVVNSEGKSEIWTAGHCVSDGKAWNSNWVFVPNYVNGWAPYGYWYAKQLWTTSAWFTNNNDFSNDVGAAVAWRNSGTRIADYLGGQGIAWNYPLQYVYAFGYPQASPFNGQTLWAERGNAFSWGADQGMVNYMTGGSSGGAWLGWFNGSWGYINGHNDYKYDSLPAYMFSPYYGNQVANLYNTVRGISA